MKDVFIQKAKAFEKLLNEKGRKVSLFCSTADLKLPNHINGDVILVGDDVTDKNLQHLSTVNGNVYIFGHGAEAHLNVNGSVTVINYGGRQLFDKQSVNKQVYSNAILLNHVSGNINVRGTTVQNKTYGGVLRGGVKLCSGHVIFHKGSVNKATISAKGSISFLEGCMNYQTLSANKILFDYKSQNYADLTAEVFHFDHQSEIKGNELIGHTLIADHQTKVFADLYVENIKFDHGSTTFGEIIGSEFLLDNGSIGKGNLLNISNVKIERKSILKGDVIESDSIEVTNGSTVDGDVVTDHFVAINSYVYGEIVSTGNVLVSGWSRLANTILCKRLVLSHNTKCSGTVFADQIDFHKTANFEGVAFTEIWNQISNTLNQGVVHAVEFLQNNRANNHLAKKYNVRLVE